MNQIPRALCLPPPGRPQWAAATELDLSYLSWGMRRYDRNPIPASQHFGWVYFCVLKGTAHLDFGGVRKRLRAPVCAILHPDCGFGIGAPSGVACEILTWLWRVESEFPALCPSCAQWLSIGLSEVASKRLVALHRESRREVQSIDEHSERALDALRLQVDLTLIRQNRNRLHHPAVSVDLALEWMQQNLSARQPITQLCGYLGVSAPTLFRLFRDRLQRSPHQCFQELRLNRARKFIRSGLLVKEAAAHLGYAHPGDLSRALRNHKPSDPLLADGS